jgi:hypothetical protein
MAALGVAVSGLALLCGPAAGQPLVNPPVVSPLVPEAPRLTSIAGAPEGCSGVTLFTTGGAYGGSADVFAGPTGLLLIGSRLQDLSGITVVLAGGERLAPTSRTVCNGGVRVTFNLPPGTSATSQARLELRAPEPPPLVKAPAAPQPACVDRLTGKPTGCPELPKPTTPRILNIADIQLTIFPRPDPDSSVRPEIGGGAGGETCRGRVIFPGRKLAQARPTPDTSAANAGVRVTVVSQSDQGILADVIARCPFGGGVLSSISAVVPVRRGPNAAITPVETCDNCSDLPGPRGRFGGWGLLVR